MIGIAKKLRILDSRIKMKKRLLTKYVLFLSGLRAQSHEGHGGRLVE